MLLSIVRVEVRGRKVRGKSVCELMKLTDRFERLSFIALDAASAKDVPEPTLDLFVSACRDRGVKAALKLFEKQKSHAQLKAIWNTQPSWWVPEKVWCRAVKGLKPLGIFAAEAFEKPGKKSVGEGRLRAPFCSVRTKALSSCRLRGGQGLAFVCEIPALAAFSHGKVG